MERVWADKRDYTAESAYEPPVSHLSAVRHNVSNSMSKIVHSYKDFLFTKNSFFFPHFML